MANLTGSLVGPCVCSEHFRDKRRRAARRKEESGGEEETATAGISGSAAVTLTSGIVDGGRRSREGTGMYSSRDRIGGWSFSPRRLFGEVWAVWKACVLVAVVPVSAAEAVVLERN